MADVPGLETTVKTYAGGWKDTTEYLQDKHKNVYYC